MSTRDAKNPWGGPGQSAPSTTSKTSKRTGQKAKPQKKQPLQTAGKTENVDKFVQAQNEHILAARKHVAQYESSSDEEDLATDSMLESVFKGYEGDRGGLNKTQQFLENVFQSGAAICLICIATVKRPDFIWSCGDCYNFFHLSCIQRWANDSTAQKRAQQGTQVDYYNNQGEFVPKKLIPIVWDCPKCRKEYEYADIPRDYTCFCTKQVNPPSQPWLVPHSCGELCHKKLQPDCGHRCVLLCHPGPCPPCPQMIAKRCDCEKSAPRMIRCAQQSWRCQQKCTELLSCRSHTCGRLCHVRTACAPCERTSQQRCQCELVVQERRCAEQRWQCATACGKALACGRHRCERLCHADACGPCPRGEPRSCPCGKEWTEAPCSEEIAPCGRTCQKTLDCGEHICAERCHKDRCGQCLLITEKRCRCGAHTKELPCSKEFTCEVKCRQQRSCQKHSCNRKCCDGQCPPCDKLCGKQLSCGKHKCTALCHQGQCYPCGQRSTMRCRCGQTTAAVPCGREKKTKPPRCQQPCRVASKCHHQQPHRCHAGECPACTQICAQKNTTTGCNHACAARCHDAVKVSLVDKNHRPAGPWDVAVERLVVQRLDHPPCEVRVAVTCLGGHETVPQPCCDSRARSCGRRCDRQLRCGNHQCLKECHEVEFHDSKKQEETCTPCLEGCIHPRPEGCVHTCERPCHVGPCAKCRVNIKLNCHCGITPVYYKCGDYYKLANNGAQTTLTVERERMQSCGNRCTRNLPCGHRCAAVCHSGICPNPELCTKKMKITCACKTRKSETTCDQVRGGSQLDCDDKCAAKEAQIRMVAEEAERRQREAEELKNRLELLEFEKKFGPRKPKKKQHVEVVEVPRSPMWMGAALVVVLALVVVGLSLMFK